MISRSTILAVLLVLVSPGLGGASEPVSSADAAFFEEKIHPLLQQHCFECHSHESGKFKGGLALDTRAGGLAGGDSGPAVVPGHPEQSLLIKAIRYTDTKLQMPPKDRRLAEADQALLVDWVQRGAPWPGSATKAAPRGQITDADRAYWFFQPLGKSEPPQAGRTGWGRNAIDAFILARLDKEGLSPAPDSDRAALARRLYFDLTGLPPSGAELRQFLDDTQPDAFEKLVDRLLESPRYGERWARHWLDLVRYAESDGFRVDGYRPHAWPYRDYVIRSFNADKPYDQFVREQLAGDELAPNDPEARIATGFLRHWIYEYNNRNVRQQWTDILNDLTDVASDVFLGLGMACARCHDHKFDPILQKDYYRLQAFFTPILPRDDLVAATPEERRAHVQAQLKWETATTELRRQIAAIEDRHRYESGRGAVIKFPEEVQRLLAISPAERTPLEYQLADLAYRQVSYEHERMDGRIKGTERDRLDQLKKELAKFDALKPAPLQPVIGVTDLGTNAPPTVLPKSGLAVQPGYPTVLNLPDPTIRQPALVPDSTGRRSALARWVTDPENPLATRVIVNRVWQYHFGRGLVATSSDFGKLGEAPSHPELLDWLGREFVRQGWSFKKLHRLIVTSSTYRQSAARPDAALAQLKDPENRWLWKAPIRRLDAEQIRDAMLMASGELDLTMGGPSVDAGKARRSIYTKVIRNTRDPLLDAFDVPEGFASTAQRNITTTPAQALLLINGRFALQRARAMAQQLRSDLPPGEEAAVIERAYWAAFSRAPRPEERERAATFLQKEAARVQPPVAQSTEPGLLAEKMPTREGNSALLKPGTAQERFVVPPDATFPSGEFTLEAFVQLRGGDAPGDRTIAAQWDGNQGTPGWSLAVSGRSSPRARVLTLNLSAPAEGGPAYETVSSGFLLEINKPYFVAVSVNAAETSESGITFYVRDLSNDDEPIQVSRVAHTLAHLPRPTAPFVIGARAAKEAHGWEGLIDDVRLSTRVLAQEQLLLTAESATAETVGFWRFEGNPGVYRDSSSHGHHISVAVPAKNAAPDPVTAAWIDFCHVLLNANEFLYVD